MAGGAGLPASWADVVALIQGEDPINFTTTTPVGTGWYRKLLGGTLVQMHWESTGTVAATTSVAPDATLPAGYRPAARTALSVVSGTSTRSGAAAIGADGNFGVYNSDSTARPMIVDGIFAAA